MASRLSSRPCLDVVLATCQTCSTPRRPGPLGRARRRVPAGRSGCVHFLPRRVLQLKVVVMLSPGQVKRPAAWGREIDDGGSRTSVDRASRRLSRTGQCRLDLQRRTESLGHPEDLVVSVRPGWCGQRVVSRPENRDDVPTIAEDEGHRLCRWVEASVCPRRERPRCEVGPACWIRCGRRRGLTAWRAPSFAGGRVGSQPIRRAPGQGHRGHKRRDRKPPHTPRLCPIWIVNHPRRAGTSGRSHPESPDPHRRRRSPPDRRPPSDGADDIARPTCMAGRQTARMPSRPRCAHRHESAPRER
jgi:hypothetical protein